MESQYWADQIAQRMIKNRKKMSFTIASGVTPSGITHMGHFREIITTDRVGRALKDLGAKVKFIYSWDDYDRFRKVPKNLPKQDILKKSLGLPVSEVPNIFKTKWKSYAEHLEKESEKSIVKVGTKPLFIRQNEQYKNCKYAKGIKTAY